MFNSIKFKNRKSVTFKVHSFEVPSRKPRMQKHSIYAANNTGFIARRGHLQNGYGIERLKMTTEAGFNIFQEITLRQIDETRIERLFCFSTHQDGAIVNCIIAVTQQGVYYVPLFGGLNPKIIPNSQLKNFDCFAYSYSRDRDFIFASNSDGIFVANYSLVFQQLSSNIRNAKQMIVFDKRLFVLDSDSKTIHFTESLDLFQFEGSICVDDSLGKVTGLDIYENRLLIICENGFKVLITSFDSSKFEFSTLCRSYEGIIEGTAKVLGDTIFFLTKGGMCQSVRGKISLLDVEVKFDEEICSTVFDNKYFLSGRNSASKNDKMIVIEKFVDSVTFYEGLGVRAFERIWSEYNNRLAVLTNEDGLVFQIENGIGKQPCIWESEEFALTYAAGNQYIRQVLLKTATAIELVVIGDRTEQHIQVTGSSDIQKINLNLKGEVFRIKIIAQAQESANGTGMAGEELNISSLSVVVGF